MKTNILLFVATVFLIVSFSKQHSRATMAQEEFTLRMGYAFLLPLIELKSESGLAYDKAIEFHHEYLSRYIKAVENKKPPLPLRLFSFSYKTINFKEIKKLKNELGKPLLSEEKNDEAHRRIEKLKKPTTELLVELKQLLSKSIIPLRRKEIPRGLREDVDKVLKESHDQVKAYISGIKGNIELEKSVKNSELACHENRKAASLSFLVSYMYEDFFVDKKMLIKFREDIDQTIYYNKVLSKLLPQNDEARGRLELYSRSEIHRRDLVQAIIDDHMQKAQKLLLDAVSKAIEEKSIVEVR